MIVWLNGQFLPEEHATISIHDRGFLHADAVFETALLHDGGFFRLHAHLDRFATSAHMLRLPAPDGAHMDEIVRALARENDLRDAAFRMTLSRGVREPVLLVTARPPDTDALARARLGWRLITARTRRPSPAAAPAQLKAVGRTYALLARQEAADAGVDDALLLNDTGHICEGPTWNIFWRTGDVLYTPALDAGVLAGITRNVLLDIAREDGWDVREGVWPRTALDDADEIFATMTSAGMVAVRALDGVRLDPETPAAGRLRERYLDCLRREAATDPL